jgi:signal transduction histidine kinase/ActR/RegA family two-component response regulator
MRGDNGGVASVMDRGFVIRDASGTAVRMIGSMTDMSIQRDLEDRLRQSTRLQAVGQLTGGIAHDFNNLLTVILGNAELLSDRLKDDPTLRAVADMTASAAERGASLTSRLLAFASKQSLAPVRTDVNPLIRGMDGLLRRTLSASISLQLNLEEGLGTVLIDHGQLENALLNLVINGRDAMPDGGLLRVATSLVWAAPARSDNLPGKGDEDTGPKAYVVVSVADSGTGMSRDVADRAFDPFFTTKGHDKGSGLGLSMVYGFARQSGGHAEIRSLEGQGTTVSLFLPRADLDRVAPQTQATAVEPVHGKSHILLVEDDPLVLEYASSQLESLGYSVTTAINGRAALALLAQLHDVDLLLTDIVMPGGLTGYDLARMAAEVRPDLKVLFTSGYSEHASDSLPGQRSTAALLSKPYRRAELALRVKVALDAKP